jgi:hypothetical protein
MVSAGDRTVERIRAKARLAGIRTDRLLQRYVLERALYRLTEVYGAKLMLKGSMLAVIDDPEGARHAPDADVHLRQREDLELIVPDLVTRTYYDSGSPTGLVEDHVEFRSFRFDALRHSGEPGVKVRLEAWIGGTRVNTSIDFGFGHGAVKALEVKTVPPMFAGLPPVVICCQPMADRLADKIRAMYDWGMENTRVKDAFDIAACIRAGRFDAAAVGEALAARNIDLSAEPAGVTMEYAERHEETWQAWLRKSDTKDSRSMIEVVDEIRGAVLAAVRRAHKVRGRDTSHLRLVPTA